MLCLCPMNASFSHVGAKPETSDRSREQVVLRSGSVMHRYALGLHSPAMDVAFQMQGMPKIASICK
jgi:hypothetical protein